MNQRIHPHLDVIFGMTAGLEFAAREVAKAATKEYRAKFRRRGATLRPGSGSPLWTALADAIRPYLKQHGQKAQLARILGLDASRVTQFFVKHSAMPDAERTLLLVQYLAQRRAGIRPS